MTERVEKVIKFLNETYGRVPQCFNSRNTSGDEMCTIYSEDDIIVDYCGVWEYIEVFGLTEDEFQELKITLAMEDLKKSLSEIHLTPALKKCAETYAIGSIAMEDVLWYLNLSSRNELPDDFFNYADIFLEYICNQMRLASKQSKLNN